MTDIAAFWQKVKRRRNLVWVTILGWLVAGLPLALGIIAIGDALLGPGKVPPNLAIVLAMVVWWLVIFFRIRRLTGMTCYRCGKQAFSKPWFSMSRVKCQNCGASPKDVLAKAPQS